MSRFRRSGNSSLDQQGHVYDPNNLAPYNVGPEEQAHLTDPHHPDYDPMVDPNLQLKTVRTAAASIAESHRSEQRRDDRNRTQRKNSISHKLFRGRTLRNKYKGSTLAHMVSEDLAKQRQSGGLATQNAEGGAAFESAQQDSVPYSATADEGDDSHLVATSEEDKDAAAPTGPTMRKMKPKKRRLVYVNVAPPVSQLKKNGDLDVDYPRNKVRTSKYTLVTFVPRFLFEQFRRVANIYFLGLVVLQVFPTFGATIPQIAMLPLVAILTITAIKDSIEDHRRHSLDNEVNNSAATRLGNCRNFNQARDPRSWYEKLLGLAGRGGPKLSKGVRKLREKEDAIGLREVVGSKRPKMSGIASGADLSTGPRTRSDSLDSSNALHTIVSESERESHAGPYGNQLGVYSQTNAANLSSQSFLQPLKQHEPSLGAQSSVDGVVDYRRHAPGTARWERTLWKKLEVGDVVLLREDEQVPADIVVLNTSDPDGNAYVETKNLDGETNLKVRKSLKATMGIQSEEDIEHSRFVVDSEAPHANLYSFNGLLKYSISEPKEREKDEYTGAFPSVPTESVAVTSKRVEPITINEMLLRGCAVRNTEWVIGLVLFTGEDTKIMLNSGETPSKRSKIEKETNFNVIVNFVILMVLCVLCAIIGGYRLSDTRTSRAFYEQDAEVSSSNIVNALIIFGCSLVVFQNIVPISLYISIEIVKTIQAFFIYQDIEMYYAPLDYPCVPKTWNISDDLGQIEYIFSDKTGTLTQNVMEFKKCSINGLTYGDGVTEAMIGAMKREGKDTSGFSAEKQDAELAESKQQMVETLSRSFKNRYLQPAKMTLISTVLANTLAASHQDAQRKNVVTFFRALALCHTALADRPDGNDPFTIEYKAESPDEAALVAAARDAGAVFIARNNNTIDIEVMGQPERYTPLKVLDFNSTRKRMSVIVREPDGRILMITKGADSVIYQRLRPDHPEELKQTTYQDLENFANAGLRTLCIAYRYLDEAEYMDWARLHDEASASLTDRDEAIDEANEKIEVELTLLGATALEDKLQVGVPEAIETLHKAGIKLWILTGDKLQTAIEIGFSCNLLTSDMEIMIISADHEAGTRAQLEAGCNKIAAAGRPVVIEEPAGRGKTKKSKLTVERSESAPRDGFAVVIDGETLRYALDANLRPLFLALTTQCEAVVCCRVSPAQKALTVKLVKDGKNAMTLAIGDGANDVAMIQEAHCGVGIAGLEGAQASMSADYAIGQFRFLTRLLLVHGQLCYHRISDLHKVFFYKNIIWTSILFYYQIHSDFSGNYIFDYTYVLLYNLVFSSLCVIVIGALDQVVNTKALLAFPQTYKRGIDGAEYTKFLFYMSMLDAAYQGAACYFLPWWLFNYGAVVGSDGQDMGALTLFGTTIAAGAVTTANLYAGIIAKHWTALFWAVEIISLLSVYAWTLVYSAFPVFSFERVGFWLVQTVNFWAVIVLITAASLIPRFFFRAWRTSFRPNEHDILREAWTRGDLKDQLGIPHKSKKSAKRAAKYQARHGDRGDESTDSGLTFDDSRDLELNEQLFRDAKRSTERQRSIGLGREAEEYSATSTEPMAADNRALRSTDSKEHQPAPKQGYHPVTIDQSYRAESGLSFYDPERLPVSGDSPALLSTDAFGQHGQLHGRIAQSSQNSSSFDPQATPRQGIPMINVQRASTSAFPNPAVPNSGDPQDVRRVSNDSFSRVFDEEFGQEYNSRVNPYPASAGGAMYAPVQTRSASTSTYASSASGPRNPIGSRSSSLQYQPPTESPERTPTMAMPTVSPPSGIGGARYHDRFKGSSPSPPRGSNPQSDDAALPEAPSDPIFATPSTSMGDTTNRSPSKPPQGLGILSSAELGHGKDGSAASGVSWHSAQTLH